MVWVSRSACQVSEILVDINGIWDHLVELWGETNARKVCRINIYVTDKDKEKCTLLRRQARGLSLAKNLHFGRPDVASMIEDHTLDMVSSRQQSSSLLAFCGSPRLASIIHDLKIRNDVLTSSIGQIHHRMDFVAESYGGIKSSDPGNASAESQDAEDKQEMSLLSSRRFSFYGTPSSLQLKDMSVEF